MNSVKAIHSAVVTDTPSQRNEGTSTAPNTTPAPAIAPAMARVRPEATRTPSMAKAAPQTGCIAPTHNNPPAATATVRESGVKPLANTP